MSDENVSFRDVFLKLKVLCPDLIGIGYDNFDVELHFLGGTSMTRVEFVEGSETKNLLNLIA